MENLIYQDTPEVQWPPRAKALRPAYHPPFVQYISSPSMLVAISARVIYLNHVSNDLYVTTFSRIMPSHRQRERERERKKEQVISSISFLCNLLGANHIPFFFLLFPFITTTLCRSRPWSSILPFIAGRFHLAVGRRIPSGHRISSSRVSFWEPLNHPPTPQPTQRWVSIATRYSRTRRLPLKRVVSPDFEIGRNPEAGYLLRQRRRRLLVIGVTRSPLSLSFSLSRGVATSTRESIWNY